MSYSWIRCTAHALLDIVFRAVLFAFIVNILFWPITFLFSGFYLLMRFAASLFVKHNYPDRGNLLAVIIANGLFAVVVSLIIIVTSKSGSVTSCDGYDRIACDIIDGRIQLRGWISIGLTNLILIIINLIPEILVWAAVRIGALFVPSAAASR